MPESDPEGSVMSTSVLRYFHPILPAKALDARPRRVVIAGRAYVLFRDAEGVPAALDDQCPHRRAPLSQGRIRPDGRIACGYHGWHFDSQGRGRSPACPDLKYCDTVSYQVVERCGFLWMGERGVFPVGFPALGGEDFQFAGYISTLFPAPLHVTLDNIAEDEHFPYIHSTFGWTEENSSHVVVETRNFEDRTEVCYLGLQRPTSFGALGGIRAGDLFHNEWSTTFEPVRTVYTFGWRDAHTGHERGILTRAIVFLVPETANVTWAQMFIFMKIAPSWRSLFRPVFHRMACWIAQRELRRDAAFVAHLAAVPSTLRGMRLTSFDKALAHNRKLLKRIYWQENECDPASFALATPAEATE